MAFKNTTSLNKTTLFRMYYIIQVFKNHRAGVPLTRKEIAIRLKNNYRVFNLKTDKPISEKQIGRDINEYLIPVLNAPINSDSSGYLLHNKEWEFEGWRNAIDTFQKNEVQALMLASELVNQYKGIPLHRELEHLSTVLKARCSEKIPDELANKIVFLSPPASHIKEDFWTSLLDALVEKKLLNIQYTSNSGKTSEVDIAPCRLASIENEWYLFCVKKDQTKVLQLAVRNIDHINLTATTFQDDYSEKIENMLDNRFGWFANDQKLERVSVVFDKSIARYMQPRIWQKKEEKEILPNGDLRISFIASANGSIPFFEVRKWILGYGSWVKEISPRKLKAGVLRDLKKTYIRLAESENMEMKKSQNIQLLRQKKAS
jgi:predicted DNA-binding transcriptional regulator YafY